MAEPTSSGAVAAAGAVGLTATAIIPGVDVNAVIGGFAGALLFVLWAHDLTIARRVGYLLASWVGGYYAATEAVCARLSCIMYSRRSRGYSMSSGT